MFLQAAPLCRVSPIVLQLQNSHCLLCRRACVLRGDSVGSLVQLVGCPLPAASVATSQTHAGESPLSWNGWQNGPGVGAVLLAASLCVAFGRHWRRTNDVTDFHCRPKLRSKADARHPPWLNQAAVVPSQAESEGARRCEEPSFWTAWLPGALLVLSSLPPRPVPPPSLSRAWPSRGDSSPS